jgi:CcmD family protein
MNDNWMFVGAAFVVTWAVLVGYFIHLQRTMRRARALLEGSAASENR